MMSIGESIAAAQAGFLKSQIPTTGKQETEVSPSTGASSILKQNETNSVKRSIMESRCITLGVRYLELWLHSLLSSVFLMTEFTT